LILFRPLPEEYLRYAREDTHYLLYIYDCLRNQLIDIKNKNSEILRLVYTKSKIICQKVKKTSVADYCIPINKSNVTYFVKCQVELT